VGRFGFVLRRLLQAIPMLFGIVLVVFMVLQVTPGDPARQIVGLRASEAELEEVREELGLNDSVIEQYVRYAGNVLQGDLGYSYKSRKPVWDVIAPRLVVTGWLLGFGVLFTLLISIPIGVLAALRKDKPTDHIIRGLGLVGLSMPQFWTGVILLLLVASRVEFFPAGGFGESTWDHFRSIILPALTLAIASSPFIIRGLRAAMISVMESDYVSTARSIGVAGGRLVRKFVLRNASGPGVTLLAIEVGYLLFGAVVIETTFALPGVGQGIVLAARSRDLPSVQGYTLLFALVVVVVYLLADVLTAILDPRVEIDS
jgi:peptide/nickel transport system permease protein